MILKSVCVGLIFSTLLSPLIYAGQATCNKQVVFQKPDSVVPLIDIPCLKYDLIYSSVSNIAAKKMYPQNAIPLGDIKLYAQLLKASVIFKKSGYGIIIYDAYRPWEVTAELWLAAKAAKENLELYSNPWEGSQHNKGLAVDIGLYSLKTGRLLKMPSAVDFLNKRVDNSLEARENARFLKATMRQCGFTSHRLEWWHFSIPDTDARSLGAWKPVASNKKTAISEKTNSFLIRFQKIKIPALCEDL